jgi:hypothetical protein
LRVVQSLTLLQEVWLHEISEPRVPSLFIRVILFIAGEYDGDSGSACWYKVSDVKAYV